jgi:hypothetical protein
MPSSFAGEDRLEQVELSIALVDIGAPPRRENVGSANTS